MPSSDRIAGYESVLHPVRRGIGLDDLPLGGVFVRNTSRESNASCPLGGTCGIELIDLRKPSQGGVEIRMVSDFHAALRTATGEILAEAARDTEVGEVFSMPHVQTRSSALEIICRSCRGLARSELLKLGQMPHRV
jgi:hypothetical protein